MLLPPPNRIILPSGAFIILADTRVITERQRRPIRAAMARFSETARSALDAANYGDSVPMSVFNPADLELMFEINDLTAAALIAQASFVPEGERCTADMVADLPGADYDAVVQAISPHIGAIMSAGVDFDPTPDRNSPTSPSSE